MIGWECPKCGSVFGPFVATCFYCGPRTLTSGNTVIAPPMERCPACDKTPCDQSSTACAPEEAK